MTNGQIGVVFEAGCWNWEFAGWRLELGGSRSGAAAADCRRNTVSLCIFAALVIDAIAGQPGSRVGAGLVLLVSAGVKDMRLKSTIHDLRETQSHDFASRFENRRRTGGGFVRPEVMPVMAEDSAGSSSGVGGTRSHRTAALYSLYCIVWMSCHSWEREPFLYVRTSCSSLSLIMNRDGIEVP